MKTGIFSNSVSILFSSLFIIIFVILSADFFSHRELDLFAWFMKKIKKEKIIDSTATNNIKENFIERLKETDFVIGILFRYHKIS